MSIASDSLYYREYRSGSEDSSDYSISYDGSVEQTIGGPDYKTFAQQLQIGKNEITPLLHYNAYDLSGTSPPPDITYVEKTSILLIDSRDRDHNVYPQPTFFKLRLPRVYRNVISVQLVQLKLLSAFFYFRATKNNITFPIYEEGRRTPISDNNGNIINTISTITTIKIREGSYQITDLLTEVQLQSNNVPLFFDFPNGFTDFSEIYNTTGDYSLNFNQPGDTVYDRQHDVYINSPTMTQIVNFYFQTNGTSIANVKSNYTVDEALVAYYYPVLKELYLDKAHSLNGKLNLTSTANPQTKILFNFLGINDTEILQLINANRVILDEYRILNTFLYRPVNQYTWGYEVNNNRITASSTKLNNSIVNLLSKQYNSFLITALSGTGITTDQFTTLYNSVLQSNAVFNSMYRFINRVVASNFGITYGTFSPQFFLNFSNFMFLQNSLNIPQGSFFYTNKYVTNQFLNINSNNIQVLNSSNYWPEMSNMIEANLIENIKQSGFSYLGNNIVNTQTFTDVSGHLNINLTTRSIDIPTDVFASKYTYFKFRSPIDQILQVETLPRPIAYRYQGINSKYSPQLQNNFDLSYNFLEVPLNNLMNINNLQLSTIPVSGINDTINILNPRKYYKYTAKTIAADPNVALYKFNVTFTILPQNAIFEDSFIIYMYHDIGVFMADANKSQYRNENTRHYKMSSVGLAKTTSLTFSFNAVQQNNYYFILRSLNTAINTINYKITYTESSTLIPIYYKNPDTFDPYGKPDLSIYDYAILYDPDIIKLPLITLNKGPVNPNLPILAPIIGSDLSGNSDDLTDYKPNSNGEIPAVFLPGTTSVAIDPINNFTFQYLNNYSENLQKYIYPGINDGSKVLDENINPYAVNGKERDYKIVQWNSSNYIPFQELDDTLDVIIAPTATPFNQLLVNIQGYSYNADQNIKLGKGVIGFTFLLSDGIWNMKDLWFKSAIIGSADPNSNIYKVGIFYTLDIYRVSQSNISLSTALCILDFKKSVQYNANSIDPGTYYQFSNSVSTTNVNIYGYTQNSNTMLNNPFDLYCAIAFNNNYKPMTITALSGTLVPYPAFSIPTNSPNYFGIIPSPAASYLPSPSVVLPQIRQIINPNAGTKPASIFTSQYQQSIPIVTTGIQYLSIEELILSATALTPFVTPILADSYSFYWKDSIILNSQYIQAWKYTVDNNGKNSYDIEPIAQNTILLDSIFQPWNSEAFLAFCTTASAMYFLGIQMPRPGPSAPYYNTHPSNNTLIVKRFDKITTQIQNVTIPLPVLLPSEFVQKFFYRVDSNNNTQYVVSTYENTTFTSRYYINNKSITTILSTIDYGHDVWSDISSSNIYILRYNLQDERGTGGNLLYRIPYNVRAGPIENVATKYYNLSQPATTTLEVTRYKTVTADFNENIYFFSEEIPHYYCQLRTAFQPTLLKGTNEYDTIIWTSGQLFADPIISLQCGFEGSLWAVTGATNKRVWAAIQSQYSDTTVTTAFQIFYPCFKASFTKSYNNLYTLTNTYTPYGDINMYPEFTHPCLFFYSNFTSFSNDCFKKFGIETTSNLIRGDFNGVGYGYNSCLEEIFLKRSSNYDNTDPNSYYYLVVRGYSPTEQFGCMSRFVVPQRYDFGNTRLYSIMNMIDVKNRPLDFNPDFSNSLNKFNANFSTTEIFGNNIIAGYNGINLTTYGFRDFLYQYSTLYATYKPLYDKINTISSNVSTNLSIYINRYLSRILPSSQLVNQNIEQSIPFTLMFKSGIPTPLLSNALDNWGLGWNMGFTKEDYSGFTFYKAPSFYKILDDYLYLQMNNEFNMNRIDTTGAENLAISRDPQGNIGNYAGKLLLSQFGSFTTSIVQNIATFVPPIGSLDQLQFMWMEANGIQVDNKDCEWDGSIQIVENQPIISQDGDSSLLKWHNLK